MRRRAAALLLAAAAARGASAAWSKNADHNCYAGHGATELESPEGSAAPGSPMSVAACEAKCDDTAGCEGVTVGQGSGDVNCYRRKDIVLSQCTSGGGYDTYVKSDGPSPPSPPGGLCSEQNGVQCYGDDIQDAGAVASAAACCEKCEQTAGCQAWTFNEDVDQHCWVKKACTDRRTGSGFVSGEGPPTPTPPPTPAPPTPKPTPYPPGSGGTFIAIGDWGFNSGCHGNVKNTCQDLIAEEMKDIMEQQGGRLKFIVNVGDSFYCDGVTDDGDSRWNDFWHKHYTDSNPARDLTSLPWYSVYGNHDMGGRDQCPCTSASGCHQVNTSTKNWILPDLTYHVTRPDLNVELIGMDTNVDWTNQICQYVSCGNCGSVLQQRTDAAVDYFMDRYAASPSRTLIVFSHYPTDYVQGPQSSFFNKLKDNSKHNIVYFGGHRHNTDQGAPSISPNEQWLVGGGGGYGCDGGQQGVVLGTISASGEVTTEVRLVDANACCAWDAAYDNDAAAPPAAGPGTLEVIACAAPGANCTRDVVPQGACLRGAGGGSYRLWCETNEHVKVDEMSAGCADALAWHFVPQRRAVAAAVGATVEYRCGAPARPAPLRGAGAGVAVPAPGVAPGAAVPGSAVVRTVDWRRPAA